jgi:excisionase family DNA binding protein
VLLGESVPEAGTRWQGAPQPGHNGMWLTTADVARRLRVSTRWVRWLARHGELPHDLTGAGQRLFRREDVWRYGERRHAAEARREARQRPRHLAAERPRMIYSALSPRQRDLPGLGPRQLRMVPAGERADPQAEVKAVEVGMKSTGSDNVRYVTRKATAASR